jgi:hypothetical protein
LYRGASNLLLLRTYLPLKTIKEGVAGI